MRVNRFLPTKDLNEATCRQLAALCHLLVTGIRIAGLTIGKSRAEAPKRGSAVIFSFAAIAICLICHSVYGQNDHWFDSWVFQGRQQTDFRQKLESQLDAQLAILNRDLELSNSQLDKLRTAGKGDINRFFNEVEKIRKKTAQMSPNQGNVQELWEIIMPIQQTAQRGLLTKDSLFRKVLAATLSGEQRRKEAECEDAKRQALYKVLVHQAIADIEQHIPLINRQRQMLVDLLMRQEKLPLDVPGAESMAGMYQLCQASEKDLSNILDADQLKLLLRYRAGFEGSFQAYVNSK